MGGWVTSNPKVFVADFFVQSGLFGHDFWTKMGDPVQSKKISCRFWTNLRLWKSLKNCNTTNSGEGGSTTIVNFPKIRGQWYRKASLIGQSTTKNLLWGGRVEATDQGESLGHWPLPPHLLPHQTSLMQWQQDLTSYVRPQMRMTFLVHFYAYFGILEKICQIISK